MAKATKRKQANRDVVDRETVYSVADAVKLVKQCATSKFDETIEVSMNLNVDPRHADQMVRDTVQLPSGTGALRVPTTANLPPARERRNLLP